jgi:hypothetical protein
VHDLIIEKGNLGCNSTREGAFDIKIIW